MQNCGLILQETSDLSVCCLRSIDCARASELELDQGNGKCVELIGEVEAMRATWQQNESSSAINFR